MASLRDFIVQNKKRLLIVLAILLLIPLIIFVTTWYIDSSRVTVANEDPRYTVTYKPTPEFTQTLKDMGLWNKGAIYITEDKSETVKKLEVVFTEIPQLGLRQIDPEGKLIWSVSNKLDHGLLKISLYISNEFFNKYLSQENKDSSIEKLITFIILSSIYNSVNQIDSYKLRNLSESTTNQFIEHESYIPFSVIYEK